MIARTPKKVEDSYLRLVRRLPLRVIRTADEHEAAVKVMISLSSRDSELDEGELEYLKALSVLAGEYEHKRRPAGGQPLEPVELLRFLMEEANLAVADVARIIGSKSAAAMILSGQRPIGREHGRKLARHFGLEEGAFSMHSTAPSHQR